MKTSKLYYSSLGIIFVLLIFFSCNTTNKESTLFSQVESNHSNIHFNNLIQPFENDTLNALEYDVMFNGAGIGVGDFNADGLQDLFFAGNFVSSKLYLNQGNFRFNDITKASGLITKKLCTGVSVADINQDGKLDIYVCVANPRALTNKKTNLLYINKGVIDGIPQFEEMAEAYGLNDSGFSVQAAFFDYDKDGDLDCYILTNAMEKTDRNRLTKKKNNGEGASNDKLYKNIGHKDGHPIFEDISSESGIVKEGHALGLCISDLDKDGWLDIYCANDFVSNDIIWMNNHDGTFTDKSSEYMTYTSFSSMGVDIQDFNNDALPDICVLDMLPEDEERRKMMVMKTNTNYFRISEMLDYQDQYVRNVLQLNQGENTNNTIKFSEIGQMSGIHATDWSWAPLLADFDNDGYKDLFISNGYRRDITNLDYVSYLNQPQSFSGKSKEEIRKERIQKLYDLSEIKLTNYLYKNKGDLTFENVSEKWGLTKKTYSNGAAYADLDNDGDLDLVFNNIDDEAGIYKNNLISKKSNTDSLKNHFVRIKLKSKSEINKTVGAKVNLILPTGENLYQENLPVRGYMSSVDPNLFFGLGENTSFDVKIVWADDKEQTIRGLSVDTLHEIHYNPEKKTKQINSDKKVPVFMSLNADSLGLTFKHQEFEFDEFKRTPSIHQQYNKNSPGLAIGDVDGNGLDDVFIGADPTYKRSVFLQSSNGIFKKLTQGENNLEDMGSLFFDANSDGNLDLYVVSGGSLYTKNRNKVYEDRLYINDGFGNFARANNRIPKTIFSGSVVTAADFDGDGDLDLFRGSRVTAGEFPITPDSYLFRNDNGVFKDVTLEVAPDLQKTGMVTSALWTDYNQDGWFDLIVVGEFMPITFYLNDKGKLILDDVASIPNSEGWWNSINSGDFDQDGDLDYIVGNQGVNSQFKASPDSPIKLYASDYDINGSEDPIITYHKNGKEVPIMIRDVLHDQLTTIMRKRFSTYSSYAKATIKDVLSEEEIKNSKTLRAVEMRSCVIENIGNNKFRMKPLPLEAQISPVFGTLVCDFNSDGFLDVLLVGNSDAFESYTGSYKASFGTLLLGNGEGDFSYVSQSDSGLYLEGNARSLGLLKTKENDLIIVANNNSKPQILKFNSNIKTSLELSANEATILMFLKNGKVERHEFPFGKGYLTQSSRIFRVSHDTNEIHVMDFMGKLTRKLSTH